MNIRQAMFELEHQNSKTNKPTTTVYWARPRHWKHVGKAICFKNNGNLADTSLTLVPSNGKVVLYSPSVKDLIDDWEIVDNTTVFREMCARQEKML